MPGNLSVRHEDFAAPVFQKNTLKKQAENSPKDVKTPQGSGAVELPSHSQPSSVTFSSKTQHRKEESKLQHITGDPTPTGAEHKAAALSAYGLHGVLQRSPPKNQSEPL